MVSYTYDLAGNRISKTHDIGSDASVGGVADQKIESFYNEQNQLALEETDNYDTNVSNPITTTASLQYKDVYTYDPNGSILTSTRTGSGAGITT